MADNIGASAVARRTSPRPFMAPALGGGYELDSDLPVPEPDRWGLRAGLHTLRHLHRYLDSLRLRLVITGSRNHELDWELTQDYDDDIARREMRRYRRVASQSGLRRVLLHEPDVVPLFGASGSSCVGWSDITWEGVRLDRYLHPGRLFAIVPAFASMRAPTGAIRRELHLMAWQPPFPTHSLVTWTNDAALADGPQELQPHVGHALGLMFCTGEPATRRSAPRLGR